MKDFELLEMRNASLYDAYCEGIAAHDFKDNTSAMDWARKHPAPQFFVTARNASLAIGKILAGRRLGYHDNNRRKFEEIFRRYMQMLAAEPELEGRLSRVRICELIVDQPAPEFYVGLDMTERIIQKEKQRRLDMLVNRYYR